MGKGITWTASWLVREGVISETDKSLFSYAMSSFLFGLAPVGIVLILGLLMARVSEGLLLITPFILLRKFCGGYHLKSPVCCVILSTFLLTIALLSVILLENVKNLIVLNITVIVASICIWYLSPIDSLERLLTAKEKLVFKIVARIIDIFFLVLYTTLQLFDLRAMCTPIGIGLIIVAQLQLLAVLKNGK